VFLTCPQSQRGAALTKVKGEQGSWLIRLLQTKYY
jgi:hypothetical protein